MQQYKTRVRRMRPLGQHHGRSTDGIDQNYYNPAIRAAKAAQRREDKQAEQAEQDQQDEEN
jgi:hypothetical protein